MDNICHSAKAIRSRICTPRVAATHRHISDVALRCSDKLVYPLYSTCIWLLQVYNVLSMSVVPFDYSTTNSN